jgi:hypothetical protein
VHGPRTYRVDLFLSELTLSSISPQKVCGSFRCSPTTPTGTARSQLKAIVDKILTASAVSRAPASEGATMADIALEADVPRPNRCGMQEMLSFVGRADRPLFSRARSGGSACAGFP